MRTVFSTESNLGSGLLAAIINGDNGCLPDLAGCEVRWAQVACQGVKPSQALVVAPKEAFERFEKTRKFDLLRDSHAFTFLHRDAAEVTMIDCIAAQKVEDMVDNIFVHDRGLKLACLHELYCNIFGKNLIAVQQQRTLVPEEGENVIPENTELIVENIRLMEQLQRDFVLENVPKPLRKAVSGSPYNRTVLRREPPLKPWSLQYHWKSDVGLGVLIGSAAALVAMLVKFMPNGPVTPTAPANCSSTFGAMLVARDSDTTQSTNGFSTNGFSTNGFSTNGFQEQSLGEQLTELASTMVTNVWGPIEGNESLWGPVEESSTVGVTGLWNTSQSSSSLETKTETFSDMITTAVNEVTKTKDAGTVHDLVSTVGVPRVNLTALRVAEHTCWYYVNRFIGRLRTAESYRRSPTSSWTRCKGDQSGVLLCNEVRRGAFPDCWSFGTEAYGHDMVEVMQQVLEEKNPKWCETACSNVYHERIIRGPPAVPDTELTDTELTEYGYVEKILGKLVKLFTVVPECSNSCGDGCPESELKDVRDCTCDYGRVDCDVSDKRIGAYWNGSTVVGGKLKQAFDDLKTPSRTFYECDYECLVYNQPR